MNINKLFSFNPIFQMKHSFSVVVMILFKLHLCESMNVINNMSIMMKKLSTYHYTILKKVAKVHGRLIKMEQSVFLDKKT